MVVLPILIGMGIGGGIGGIIGAFAEKRANDARMRAATAKAEQQAKRAEARARHGRQQAQVDRLVSDYRLPISAKSELATWAAAGDAGIKRIERALAAGTSDTAKKLRNHDKHRRELLELRDEVLQVSMRAGE